MVEVGSLGEHAQRPTVQPLETVPDLLRLLRQMDVDRQVAGCSRTAATAALIAACGTARTECSASPRRRFGSSAKTFSTFPAS